MTTTVHVLKTTAAYFEAVWSGEKTFDVRYDDRGYQRGHQVRLREFDPSAPCTVCPRDPGEPWHTGPDCAKFSGREVHADIGHVLASTPQASKARQGFNGHGYVVFSLLNVGTFDRGASDMPEWERDLLESQAKDVVQAVARIAAASGGERS